MTKSEKRCIKGMYWLLIMALALLGFIAITTLSGCEVLKKKSSLHRDSTSVHSVQVVASDSSKGGNVKKDSSKTKEEFEWWRIIQQFASNRDTNIINNNYYPQKPSSIIIEGGKGSRTEEKSSVDSSWWENAFKYLLKQNDSTRAVIAEMKKDKESQTRGFGLMSLTLLAAGYLVVSKGLSFIGNRYQFKINKKSTI